MSYNPFVGVSSFNSRQGAVTLSYSDVTGALGFTPTSVSGAVSGVAAAIGTGLAKSDGSALSAAVAGAGGDYVAPGAITSSGLTMATARLLGRTTASTGAVESISVGDGLSLAGGTLSGPCTIIGQSAAAITHTGTTSETTLATITIPAGAMGPNGRIEIDVLWSYPSSANSKTFRQKFGATTITTSVVSTGLALRTSALVANRGATNSQVASPNFAASFGASPSVGVTTSAIDTTAAVNITLTAQLGVSTDTVTLEAYSVKLFK